MAGLSVAQACVFVGVSRQAFYQQRQRWKLQKQKEGRILSFVLEQRRLHPKLGARKLHALLHRDNNAHIGRDRLFSLLREHRLLVKPKRAYHKTTHSHHRFYCHPNLVKESNQQIKVTTPERLWVADITYLPLRSGEAYLSLVTDAYSRKVVGYHVDDNLKAGSVLKAYSKALKARKKNTELVHHSDRGIQYCSKLYQSAHEKHGVTCSMTDGYDCYQNALAERVNGILKNEYLLQKPKDLEEARKMVEESVYLYNHKRPHMALKYKTPDEVHQAF